jgi:CubicO group peptidase (beta-lactamase class C family)
MRFYVAGAAVALASPASAKVVHSTMKTKNPELWAPLKEQLDNWILTENFGITVGNASGPLFEYTHGNFSLDTTKCDLASSSKWPLAMMFVGLVADGSIGSLDDPANKYVSWWTKDATDEKSEITLRQLLSFTSGFGDGEWVGGGGAVWSGGVYVARCCLDTLSS